MARYSARKYRNPIFKSGLLMLNFPRNALAYHLEDFLDGSTEVGDESDLSLPASLYLMGGLGSSTQAVQAIAQLSTKSRLNVKISEEDSAESKLSESLHGMAAIYFADTLTKGHMKFQRSDSLKDLVPRVLAMRSQNHGATKSNKIATLCCFSGAKMEFLPAVYSNNHHFSVRPPSELSIAFRRMLDSIGSNALKSMTDGAEEYINILLHELFSNADEHGSFDVNGDNMRRGVRGIHMQITSMENAQDIARDAGDDKALRFYLAGLPLQERFDSSRVPSLLEMNIFDTGPGMGLSWLSRSAGVTSYEDFSVADELEAVSTCFKKRATTKTSSVRGQGLPTVLRALSKLGAFMTVRTGRMSLYQDFSNGQNSEFSPKARFGDRTLSLTSGTSFTVWFRIS